MLNPERRAEVLFPHDEVRPIQDELVLSVERCVQKGKHLVVHAPTGLGKTAATLGPALAFALKEGYTVFFLTSRHTQHRIAIETAQEIARRYGVSVPVANIIGKKWMCLQPGVEGLYAGEFVEYCRTLREDKKCSFYENLRRSGTVTIDAKLALEKALRNPDSRSLRVFGQEHQVCPYEIGVLAAQQAVLIVTDYFYLFNEAIRQVFLQKTGKDLSRSIVIVDEAHNLPDRVKDLASVRTSTRLLDRAVHEAEKYGYDLPVLAACGVALSQLAASADDDGERYVLREELFALLPEFDVEELRAYGDGVREEQQRSFLAGVAEFLAAWSGPDEGFTRILSVRDENVVLSFRCLDPGRIVGSLVQATHSTILMSGTLSPTVMYAELLDIPLHAEEYTFRSPFPDENRLTLIVPQTTTKYQARSEQMYVLQARILAQMIDAVPGNSIAFFPSYVLRDRVEAHLRGLTKRTLFREERGMGKGDREELLKRFAGYTDSGACILGVMSGSFAEGVDYPGDLLRAVFVVGLPLARPDKETQALIQYYEDKFRRGWDYGYVFPAFNKVLQSAGRCIRSASDRGVLVFLDARYAWRSYQRCFPPHWDLRMSADPAADIAAFFGGSGQLTLS